MRREALIFVVALMLACLPCTPALAWFGSPTAIIVDDETGEPIEGAIALAQWVKYKGTFFEGGIPYAAKAEETVSDKEGRVYIKGYWTWNPFACDRHLTVYKPGYALWNSEKEVVYPPGYKPKKFSSWKNVVRLVPFEKAAEKWKKIGRSQTSKKWPRQKQVNFFGGCLELELKRKDLTIINVFRGYEIPRLMKEEAQMRRAYESLKQK